MRTKIVATLGPSSMEYAKMKAMVEYGVRIFRLNFSHSNAEFFAPVIKIIRQIESETGIPLTALGDLCGPKTRVGDIEGAPYSINKGDLVMLGLPDMKDKAEGRIFIPLDFPELLKGLQVGMTVSISDGIPQFKVTRVVRPDQIFELESQNPGLVSSRKGIAFPGKTHHLPALTPKDIKDLHEGLDAGIDAAAISFVQNQQDIADIKAQIHKHGVWVPVVAKLERQNSIENLDAILKLTDVVMVARGDLGQECPLSELPIIQKRMLRACRHAQKPAIVATQMLLSMVKNALPTRAETTDVANAILDGADCVMLSEETAMGNYPVEAVQCMSEIIKNAEAYYLERLQAPYAPKKERNPAKYLAYAACIIADNAESQALVTHSTSGATARLLSSRRPSHSIHALSPDERVVRGLNFCWGVQPHLVSGLNPSHMERAEEWTSNCPDFPAGSNVVITAGQPTPGQTEMFTNEIKIYYK